MSRGFVKHLILIIVLGLVLSLLVACSQKSVTRAPGSSEKKQPAANETTNTLDERKPHSPSKFFEQEMTQSSPEIDSAMAEIDSILKEIDGIDRSQDNEPKL